jgi:diadenosine tetraphosphate (Ap4A) HIT family hydrolase
MDHATTLNEFRSKFRVDELLVVSTDAWSWSVRPHQPTLGAGVLSLNRHALHLSDVTSQEMAELATLVAILEKAVKSAFGYDIMNYLMLMMVDRHVHYHVIPRYKEMKQFAGVDWVDNGWPTFPALRDDQHANVEGVLAEIRAALVAAMRSTS